MKRITILAGWVLMATILLGCHKCKDCMIINPFDDLHFRFKRNNNYIEDSLYLSKIELYYYDHGRYVGNPAYIGSPNSTTISDDTSLMLFDPQFVDSGVLRIGYLSIVSAQHGINTFYFKFPDGDIDTLWVKAEQVSNEQGKHEACYCTDPIRELKFNGKTPEKEPNFKIGNRPVYIFNK